VKFVQLTEADGLRRTINVRADTVTLVIGNPGGRTYVHRVDGLGHEVEGSAAEILALLAEPAPSPSVEADAGIISRRVYHGTDEHRALRAARFSDPCRLSGFFPFDGATWRYAHTSSDSKGAYDQIERSRDEQPAPSVEVTEAAVEAAREAWNSIPSDNSDSDWRAAIEAALREMGLRR
jgi:hypothetical protein